MSHPRVLILSFAALAAAGCNCGPKGGGGGGHTLPDGGIDVAKASSLSIDPVDPVLDLDGNTARTIDFKATVTFSDGSTADATAQSGFTIEDQAMGTFTGPTYTSSLDRGGVSRVLATTGALSAHTSITQRVHRVVNDPSSTNLPPDPGSKFGGPADATAAPDIVYPNDGTLLPPNLRKLEFHFMPKGNTLFELSFANALTDVKVYLSCTALGAGCVYLPDPNVWRWVADANRGGDAVKVTLRGTDANGTRVGTSASINLSFSRDDLAGGIYYWTTSSGTAIMRYDFASDTQTQAKQFIGTSLTGGTCVGCHALSHDGTKMVAEAGGQNDGRVLLLDVAKTQPLVPFPSPAKSIFESWKPDGSQYVGVYGDTGATDFNLMLFDGASGAKTTSIAGTGDSTHPADHPDWSLDGTRIVYTHTGIKGTNQRPFRGSIDMVTAQGGSWSAPVELVPGVDGKNRYYPSFAPDGAWVIFNESTCPAGQTQATDCNGDTDPTATLFIVPAAGGAPIRLDAANAQGKTDTAAALTNSFPKWSPFVFQKGEVGSRLEWFTFSSTRNFGLRPPPTGGGDQNTKGTLIWMAAFDPDKAAQGLDPSYPAFALPFQDLTTSNHIAQWTTIVVPPIN